MENLIIIVLIAAILGGAGYYIYRAKKKGQACIGCPSSKTCKNNKCNCSCSNNKP